MEIGRRGQTLHFALGDYWFGNVVQRSKRHVSRQPPHELRQSLRLVPRGGSARPAPVGRPAAPVAALWQTGEHVAKVVVGIVTVPLAGDDQRIDNRNAIACIGFPIVDIQGFSPKVTRGEISSMNGAGDDPKRWQISAPVEPGNSGGPLLDECGNVVGIVVSKLSPEIAQNVNYATKSTYALGLLEPYLDDKAPKQNTSAPPPRFEDMIAKAQQSVVLILVY